MTDTKISSRIYAINELARMLRGTVHRLTEPTLFTIGEACYSVFGKFKERSILIDLYAYNEIAIKIDCDGRYWFLILPNSFFNRFDHIWQPRVFTGNSTFDSKFVTRSHFRLELRDWLTKTKIRDTIVSLAPFIYLKFHRGLIRYSSKFDFEQPDVAEILSRADILNMLALSLETIT